MRQAVAELDPLLPFVELKALRDVLRPTLQPRRLGASMFGVFGLLALVLAAVGLYGVIRRLRAAPLRRGGAAPQLPRMSAIQDLYPDEYAHCYGCGRLNAHGLHVRSEWMGDQAVARFTPQPYHIAMPGYVYGGLIASLLDCHSIGTAAAAAMVAAGQTPGRDPTDRKSVV